MTPSESELRDEAVRYARRGLFVFPLGAGSKVPLRGTHGYKSASSDESQIREWWGSHPNANVGIATGRSGLVVLDLDRKNGVDGFARLPELEERLGPLPGPTKMVSTPSGGGHLYFRTEAELKNGPLVPGVDVCVYQIMAPPSIVNGKSYRWDMFDVPTAELPERWTEALRKPKPVAPTKRPARIVNPDAAYRYGSKVLDAEASKAAETATNRNDALTRCVFRVGRIADQCGIASGDAEKMFLWAVRQWDDPSELSKGRRTFWQAFRAGQQNPRGDLRL